MPFLYIKSSFLLAKYHQYLWDISANVVNYFGLFATHSFTNSKFRYAITDIETRMQNRHSEAKEVFFDMYIPKEAFVSNFTMVIKGKTYQANVKTKEVAKQIYEDSTDTSGLLQTTTQPEFTDGKQVKISHEY